MIGIEAQILQSVCLSKAAIAALENAGFVERGSNTPHVFATGITVHTMDEARQRLTRSPLFDEGTREEAARIISSLISRRATTENSDEAESRIDYLADVLGMTKETVIRSINLMRQEGLLADSHDMQALAPKPTTPRELNNMLRLERFLLMHISEVTRELNYKELNEEAQKSGIHFCNVKRIKTLLYFLRLKGYVHKEEHTYSGSVSLRLQTNHESTLNRHNQRARLCQYVIGALAEKKESTNSTSLVNFSIVELLNKYNDTQLALDAAPTLSDMEEALLYLSKTELLKLEGGFLVIYNTMLLKRKVERRQWYGKEQYRILDEFYRQRIQQIHIVGEYANLMVRVKGERRTQIGKNITPAKYNKIFGSLSEKQLEIINDNYSRCIVVAAGPGSGKTRVLVHKLASLLLLEDVKHEQLLMLTFSRAAATEFKVRLMDLVGHAAHFVDIKTFHSYAFDLLGRQGSLEEADDVVRRAAEMIESGEVEASKIAKSVLVIDEAQDMGFDDYRLVLALIQRNEEMRLIAVGDDDQNIYAFRGSNSEHLRSLVTERGGKLYEMTDNYRSDRSIVDYANRFVQRIPNRMKQSPIVAVSKHNGNVQTGLSTFSVIPKNNGTTAVLTRTNEQALQVACILERRGIHALLVQSGGGFRFINLAEVKYFVKHLGTEGSTITKEQWLSAKERTRSKYASSHLLPAMQRFWNDYEMANKNYYRSDLRQFLLESEVEDFRATDDNCTFVSTIHKAKGREFDNVHLFIDNYDTLKVEDLRATLRSGDTLHYTNGYLATMQGEYIACLSRSKRQEMDDLRKRGYTVASAEVSYILAWRPREETEEVAVCLANLILKKQTNTTI